MEKKAEVSVRACDLCGNEFTTENPGRNCGICGRDHCHITCTSDFSVTTFVGSTMEFMPCKDCGAKFSDELTSIGSLWREYDEKLQSILGGLRERAGSCPLCAGARYVADTEWTEPWPDDYSLPPSIHADTNYLSDKIYGGGVKRVPCPKCNVQEQQKK